MKHLFFSALTLCVFTATAQSPVYLLFNNTCMQQLEYKYTRSGETLYAYSYKPNADEQYIFMSSSSGMPTQNLPVGTYDCNTVVVTDEAVKIINEQSGSRQMYILIQQPTTGYLMMPVYSAVQIKRYGSWYLLVGPKYTFAIDTMDLNYQKNLQGEASPTVVRFRGSQLANCRYQYTFQGDAVRGNTENIEFDYIYGIGIVRSKVGSNLSELEANEMRLNRVNGQYYDAYLASLCQQTAQQYNTDYSTPGWTNPAPSNNYIYGEPDKEYANPDSQPNQYSTSSYGSNLITCPTPPGAGYHIVQPRQSLKAIARTYNVDLKSIIKWNNIKNPDHIEVCQQIWLQKPPANAGKAASYKSPAVAQYSNTPQTYGTTVPSQANYWGGNQQSYAVAQYGFSTKGGTHVVQKSETLFGIAKRYACAEECIRRANNFPLEGNVIIKIGQTLIIPECTCQTTGSAVQPTQMNYRSVSNTPPQIANVLNTQTKQQQPPTSPNVYYDNANQRFIEIPGANRVVEPDKTPLDNEQQGDKPPTKEYIVHQGETLSSIAIKHKMSLSELANINGLAQDDKVTAGRRLVVRQY